MEKTDGDQKPFLSPAVSLPNPNGSHRVFPCRMFWGPLFFFFFSRGSVGARRENGVRMDSRDSSLEARVRTLETKLRAMELINQEEIRALWPKTCVYMQRVYVYAAMGPN